MAKNRKWSNLKGQIPDEPVEVNPRELLVREEADKWRGADGKDHDMSELAREYQSLCEEEEFEDLARKVRSVKYEGLERVIRERLEKVMELSGQDMWRGEGQVFSPKYQPIPTIADRTALVAWLKEKGIYQDLLILDTDAVVKMTKEALDTDMAVTLTPGERAKLQPGDPASGQPPPGVSVFFRKGVNRTEIKRKAKELPDD